MRKNTFMDLHPAITKLAYQIIEQQVEELAKIAGVSVEFIIESHDVWPLQKRAIK